MIIQTLKDLNITEENKKHHIPRNSKFSVIGVQFFADNYDYLIKQEEVVLKLKRRDFEVISY